jgi:YfiH family protein
MTTRQGGVSKAPWDQLNLGLFSGDDPIAVQQNRSLVSQQIKVPAAYIRQVHGTHGVFVDGSTPSTTEADVAWTTQPQVACTIMAADCLPILMCHPQKKWVAAAHAGWRGLAGADGHGVVETLAQAAQKHGLLAEDCLVWLGPCIGPTAFEVGLEVVDAFSNQQRSSELEKGYFVPSSPTKFLADLAGLARDRLISAGFKSIYGNDSTLTSVSYTHLRAHETG